ncbi:MAG TPA: penicillin-binding protein 1C [Vicinamibacteria bacterium]|nr:penicillin-binding protein 1C [Vicinamibacteria bacterium]
MRRVFPSRWFRSVRRTPVRVGAGIGLLLSAFWLLVPVVSFDDPLSTVVLDRDGQLLGASIAADGQWRFGVAEAVPEKFAAAITTFEDRRFRFHPGVDPLALVRAAATDVRRGRVVSGGSTLTMQVVRLARKGRPRTLVEKAVEAVLAVRLTLSLSKEQVLGLYAAYAPFGGNTVGLDAAAWRYFGRAARQLSWAEAATLAVLPNAPALVYPGRNRDLLLSKRNRLLDALRQRGVIDPLSAELAKRERLPPAPEKVPMLAPHLVARVRSERRPRRFQAGDASPWVRTTLRLSVQQRLAEVLGRHRRVLAENGVFNAAALVLDVPTGEVLAYVGNQWPPEADEHGEHVDVVAAPRSTGSVLKPLLFASMLEAGEVLPTQLVPDVPTHIGSFHPENFDREYAGAVPAAQALARSLNVPAVRMLRAHGVDRFCSVLRRLGITTLDRPGEHYGLALILGGAEGTLWDVTGVYAGLARSALAPTAGEARGAFFAPSCEPRPAERGGSAPIAGPAGRSRANPSGRGPSGSLGTASPLGPAASYLTLRAMLEVERPGDEVSWRSFGSARKVAWKTGTSYGFRDAWAVGVTPRHAVGIWVGNASGEGRPGLTGHSAAAPILFDVFDSLPGGPFFPVPAEGLVDVDVCARSGMRAGPSCETRRAELVPTGGLDSPPCTFCRLVHTDPTGQWQVHADCEPVETIRTAPWFVLPPALEVHYRRLHADYRPPPPFRPDCRAQMGAAGAAALSFVYPREGASVLVPLEMDGSTGRVVFEAAHRDKAARVFWHLDDEYLGETIDVHEMALAPRPGPHVLVLVDERGETVRRRFTVVGRGGRGSDTLPHGPVVQLVRTAGS